MDFEYNADADFKIDADKARDCLRVQNFVKLNQVLRPIIPFLKEARDAIEIADFFHLNFKLVHQITAQNNESIKSNKHLALERFKDVQSKKGNPILHVDDLPFGRLIIKNLVASRSIDYISNVFMPDSNNRRSVHKIILRPSQNANSPRRTAWLWHQDASFHQTFNDITIWIPLCKCGRDSPGLEFLNVPKLRKVFEVDKDQYNSIKADLQIFLESKYERYAPEYNIGDCVVFNSYAIHRTYVHSGMNQDRTSLDLRISP